MPSPVVDVGTSATLTMSSGTWVVQLEDIDWSGRGREFIQTSHQDTANGYHTFKPKKLIDPGKIEVSYQVNPDKEPPITQTEVTLTITHASGAVWSCLGFFIEDQQSFKFEDKMMGKGVFKLTGPPTITPAV